MKRIIALIIVVLTMVGVYAVLTYPSPEAVADLPITKTKYEIGPPDPTEMLELVNIEREKVGVAPLKYDANVEKAAQLKADDFAKRDYYSHNVKGTEYILTAEMAEYMDRSCKDSTENIGKAATNSAEAISAWMGSKPHREALLDKQFDLVGFGVISNPTWLNGHYVVQHLCVAK